MDIYKFWKDVLEQNADAVRDYFDKNADIYWHCTNEHFNVDEFIIANCEYPGSWSGKVEKVEKINDDYGNPCIFSGRNTVISCNIFYQSY